MLTKKNFILTLFVSIFVSIQGYFIIEESSCDKNARIDENKLAGKWNFVAQVSTWTDNYCGHMSLKDEAEKRFSGYWIIKTEYKVINETLNAHLYDDIFELSYDNNNKGTQLMKITTCNGDDEFALEDTAKNWFYIFSRNDEISPAFFERYQLFADSHDLFLTFMDTDNCRDLSRSTKEEGDEEDDLYDYGYGYRHQGLYYGGYY